MNARSQLRKKIRQRRNELSTTTQHNAALALTESLAGHCRIQQAKRIAIYLTNDGELPTSTFIDWCWHQKKEVYLPVVHPFSPGNLLFLLFQPNTKLVSNTFGILEPQLDVTTVCPLTQLDIILTPLVAFDNSGARLGMGGGFYDRSLAQWQQKKFYPMGVAHDCQRVDKVPTESWDIPLPEIITPSKSYQFFNESS
jgi:5-formyltetrahydrofolate cyclo-ligase